MSWNLWKKDQGPSPSTCTHLDCQLTVMYFFGPLKLMLHHLSNTISRSGVEYQCDDALSAQCSRQLFKIEVAAKAEMISHPQRPWNKEAGREAQCLHMTNMPVEQMNQTALIERLNFMQDRLRMIFAVWGRSVRHSSDVDDKFPLGHGGLFQELSAAFAP